MNPARPTVEQMCVELVDGLDGAAPFALGEKVVQIIGAHPDVRHVSLWIADYSRTRLVDLSRVQADKSVAGSVEGRSFSRAESVWHEDTVSVPVRRRGETLGVLSVACPPEMGERLHPLAVAIANGLIAGAEQSDRLPAGRGAERLTLPATIQHRLLPMGWYPGPGLEIGAQLEPAYDIAGDTFDYSVEADGVHVGLFDAVGHGLRASLIATTTIGAYRRGRLIAESLPQLAESVDRAVSDGLDTGEFVTGLLMWIDAERRTMELWNAGHLPPALIRGGQVLTLAGDRPCLPFGLGTAGRALELELEPGDLIVAYTDGVVQARDLQDQMLGDDVVTRVASQAGDTPLPELCRMMLDGVAAHVPGHLTDDATIVGVRLPS